MSCEDVCNIGLGLGLGGQGMCGDGPRSEGMRKKPCFPRTGLEPSLSLGLRAMEESADLQCQGSPQSDVSSFCNTRVKREMDQLGSAERACRRVAFDEDEDVNARKKLRLTKQQSALLENSFKENTTLSPKQKLALAKQLNLRPRQVEVWFQNRRARTKLKQTEVDCEYLKNCCELLTKENKRLQKEINELKKVAPQLYMHVPAATLTVCPSCERISGAGIDTVSTKVPYASANKPHLHNPYNRSSATW